MSETLGAGEANARTAEDAVQALEASDPAKIGPFVLRARLGQGGMGLVYLGTDSTGRDAAVKVIQPSLVQDRSFHDRFLREARLLASVAGACTARVLAADIDAEPGYLAVEYVPGPTLHERVLREGALPSQLLRPLAVGLLEALDVIHQHGVVHRDLKPANIILSREGPKVIDFGIARLSDSTGLTTAGAVLGSPGWMAPEQFSDAASTTATDVFAWGATMAFAATGRVPFAGDRLEAVYVRVLHDAPDLADVPPEFLPLLEAALAKSPQDRPSVRTLLAQLLGEPTAAVAPTSDALTVLHQAWSFDVPTVVLPVAPEVRATAVTSTEGPPRTFQAASRRPRWAWAAAAVVALALAGGGAAMATQQAAKERRMEAVADQSAADKAAENRASTEKAAAERAAAEKAAAERIVAEKAAADRAAAEKAAAASAESDLRFEDPEQLLQLFFAAWRANDSSGMQLLSTREALRGFAERPEDWVDYSIAFDDECELNDAGLGGCLVGLIAQEGGAFYYDVRYGRVGGDDALVIYEFTAFGGGA